MGGVARLRPGPAVAGGERRPAGPAAPRPTATSTPWSRCSTPPPGSPTGCRPGRPRCSWTAWPARRSRATPWPTGRRTARPSASSPPTASKGLEWDVVVVAGVQEGIWPDLRLRSSLLGMDELVDAAVGRTGPAAGTDAAAAALASKLLSEERRLFYVAATRARRLLVVTAVGRGGQRGAAVPVPGRAGRRRDRDRARRRVRAALAVAARADRRPAPGRRRPATGRPRCGRPRPPSWPGWPQAGVRGADPRHWYQLTALSDPGPRSGRSAGGRR